MDGVTDRQPFFEIATAQLHFPEIQRCFAASIRFGNSPTSVSSIAALYNGSQL
jgi:hypothetical protein